MKSLTRIRSERGAALVEFVLVTTFLLLPIFVGITEFGLLFYNKQVLTNGTREGARAGIMHESIDIVKDIVETYCNARLVTLKDNSTAVDRTVKKDDIGVSQDPVLAVYNSALTVSVEYEYTFLIPQVLGLDPTLTLDVATTMSMERIIGSP